MRVVKHPETTAEGPEELDFSENVEDATEDTASEAVKTAVASQTDEDALFYDDGEKDAAQRLQQLNQQLNQPLDRALVKQRQGAFGAKLDYLEWHTVVRQLNRIFGVNKWQTSNLKIETYGVDEKTQVPLAVSAQMTLEVRFPTGYSEYTNAALFVTVPTAIKDASGKTIGHRYTWEAFEMAYKGAVSEALKRCATALGDQFGLSLYAKEEKVKEERVQQGYVKAQPKPEAHPQRADAEGAEDTDAGDVAECENCGKEIRGYTHSRSGRVYTTTDLVDISKRKYGGRIFCYTCGQNAR